jgi:hypothetical protein
MARHDAVNLQLTVVGLHDIVAPLHDSLAIPKIMASGPVLAHAPTHVGRGLLVAAPWVACGQHLQAS